MRAKWLVVSLGMLALVTFLGYRISLALSHDGNYFLGKSTFIRNGLDAIAGNAFNFIVDYNDTTPFGLDQAGMALRNANGTDGNYTYLSFQSNRPDGVRYHGAGFLPIFKNHVTGETELQFYVRGGNGVFTDIMTLKWDADQGGPTLGLGVQGSRQGIVLKSGLPIAWDDGSGVATDLSLKRGDMPHTMQIGDNFSDNGFDYVLRAPIVATGHSDKSGGNLVFQGGNSTGTGIGGAIQFAVASPDAISHGSSNLMKKVLELAGLSVPVFRPIEDGVVPLGDAQHQWKSAWIKDDIYRQSDTLGLFARMTALEGKLAACAP